MLHKPFDNAKIRQAALYALNQKDFLLAGIDDPKYYKECKALFICGTPFATDKGFEDKLELRLRQVEGDPEAGRL